MTRVQKCFCGTEWEQTATLADGYTDLGGPVEKDVTVWQPPCPSCSRAKIRAEASQ